MSISGSLSNAVSGLTAASRAAEVISANVSNALTEGYGRRQLELVSGSVSGVGGGVRVASVSRLVDQQTVGERRIADAQLGNNSAQTKYFEKLELSLGVPDQPGSITDRVAKFESALIEGASRPDSDTRLAGILRTGQDLSDHLNSASKTIQNLRMTADHDISVQVDALNAGLGNIEKLNFQIRAQVAAGRSPAALIDQRQQQIDGIATIVPLREVDRGNGMVALFTPGGAILLDGNSATIEFTAAGTIVPQMTLSSGALSGLTINGQPIAVDGSGPLSGGSLAGFFNVRDELSVASQSQIDAVARDLIERFADPAVDPTLAATDPGFFTDAGAALSVANEVGIAGRIATNSLIDPAKGGDLWKIRDGLGAVAPLDVGNSSGIQSLHGALLAQKVPLSGGFSGVARTASGLSGDLISSVHSKLTIAHENQSFSQSLASSLKLTELENGVDTDAEMQRLLLVEQAYSANARVISTVDQMIQTLLGL